MPASCLTSAHIAAYIADMSARGCSNSTCNKHLRVIKALAARMKEAGIGHGLQGIKAMREEEAHNTPFGMEQQQALSQYFKTHQIGMYMVAMLQYHAFMRPAEIARLKVADIDCKARLIRLSGAQTKNGRNANIPITAQLLQALEEYGLEGLPKTQYLVGKGIAPADAPVCRTRLNEAHTKALKACHLNDQGFTLYTWKDTGACNAYRSGIDIKTLQYMLRHSSVAVTEVYLRSLGRGAASYIQERDW